MATLEERIQNLANQMQPMGTSVMSDADIETPEVSQTRLNKILLSDIQPLESKDMMQSRMPDLSVMQPLVDLGYEQEIRTMLTFPMDCPDRDWEKYFV